MAPETKKKSVKQTQQVAKIITENIPIEELKFINQPIPITFMRGDFSPIQTSIIVEIVDQLQPLIEARISKGIKTSLFDDDSQGTIMVDFPIRALGLRADQNNELEDALKRMQTMQITYDEKREDGDGVERKYKTTSVVFPEFSIPKTTSANGNQRRTGNVYIEIKTEAAKQLFRMDQYHKYIKAVTRNCSSQFTARIYMFITAYRKFGTWKPLYTDLHEMLGFSRRTKDGVEMLKYKEYKDFKKRVLRVAESELRSLAEEGSVDCYFEFSEVYPAGKKRGTPEKILFQIMKTTLGEQVDENNNVQHLTIQAEAYMRNELSLRTSDISKILKLLSTDDIPAFQNQMEFVKHYVDGMAEKPTNPRGYYVKALMNWLNDRVPDAQEVVDEKPDIPHPEDPVSTPDQFLEQKRLEEIQKLFIRFTSILYTKLPKQDYFELFTEIKYRVEENEIVLVFNDDEKREKCLDKYNAELIDAFNKAFGESYTWSCD